LFPAYRESSAPVDAALREIRSTTDESAFAEDTSARRTGNVPVNLATTRAAVIAALKDADYPHAFARVEYLQMAIVGLFAIGATALPPSPRQTRTSPLMDS